MAFESAQRNFLQRTTRGFYRHAPMLNFNEKARFTALLCPPKAERKQVVLATQVQMQDKYRKRGWKLMDNLVHPVAPGFGKVYMQNGQVTVIYPDASVSRHQRAQVEYERGWHSVTEQRHLATIKVQADEAKACAFKKFVAALAKAI